MAGLFESMILRFRSSQHSSRVQVQYFLPLCVYRRGGSCVCVCVCLWCEGCFPFCYRPSVNKGTCGWVRYQSGHSEGICIINYHSWTGGQSDLPSHLYRVPDDEHPGLGAWDTAVPCTGIQRLPGQDVWPAYIDHGGETVSDLTPAWAICMACTLDLTLAWAEWVACVRWSWRWDC